MCPAVIGGAGSNLSRRVAPMATSRAHSASSAAIRSSPARLGATPMQVALAWLLQRSPNILLIPGTSSVAHLRENLAAAELVLSAEVRAELEAI